MRTSLVVRMTAWMAAILTASFAAWVLVVHRSTTATFVEARFELASGAADAEAEDAIRDVLERAWRRGGWEAVREVARRPDSEGVRSPFLVLGPDLDLAAATGPRPDPVDVVEDPDGTLRVRLVRRDGRGEAETELTRTDPVRLRGADGTVWGRLIVLPRPAGPEVGERFAADVWRSAAIGLVAVAALAMATTAWILRRSLAPVDRLTRAARELRDGRIPAPVAGVADTEFGELVEAFDEAIASLDRTARLRRRWIADIAHELRTPVTNLKGQLEACGAGLIEPDAEFLETLRGETRLLERLVEDFQQLAISDAGELRLRLQPLPLAETVAGMLGPMAEAAGAAVEIDVAGDLRVIADEERLRQVIANLMDNAVRHRPDRLRVRVTAEADDRRVTIRFADNGPGVAEVDRPHLFERFYRADPSRSRASGGAGLGLAIVHGLLVAMDGSIRHEHGQDGGATFAFTLPRAAT